MTRNTAIIAYIAHAEASRDIVSQATLEGEIARGERNDWRANALEMAGEYALVAGGRADSRKFAKQFEEGE